MQEELYRLLREKSIASRLSWADQVKLAEETGLTLHAVTDMALAQGILPMRYQRNVNAISAEEQNRLSKAQVAVVGCGGLGGYVIEELARLGVGSITAWDYDYFEEHNLNRQLLAEMDTIGQSKVDVAAQHVKAINPEIDFTGFFNKFDDETGARYLVGKQVVIDALDNIPSRLMLSNVCRDLNIPLVHGAVGGWYGQVSTQFPEDNTIDQLYGQGSSTQGIEVDQGVLSFMPAMVASLQVAEVTKILLGRGDLLRGKVMFINLLEMEMEVMELPSAK